MLEAQIEANATGFRVPSAPIAAESWRSSTARAVLREVTREDVNLVVWQRRGPSGVKRALAAWARACPPSFDGTIRLRDGDPGPLVATMPEPLRARMARDIATLLASFANVSEGTHVRLTFGVVRTDRCRKFHADFVRYRMITTYLGPGTEWLPETAVDRAAMARSIECPFEANRAILRPNAKVHHAVAGDVLLMKGAVHPSARGAVHRSPPLSAADPVRVLLTMSTVDD